MSVTTAPESPLEHLYELKDLSAAGYGHVVTLRNRIRRGEMSAIKIGNKLYVRQSDVAKIGVPMGSADLDALVERIVAEFPRLDADQKATLASLLGGGPRAA